MAIQIRVSYIIYCSYELQVFLRMELESIMYGSENPAEGAYDELVDEVNFKLYTSTTDSPS